MQGNCLFFSEIFIIMNICREKCFYDFQNIYLCLIQNFLIIVLLFHKKLCSKVIYFEKAMEPLEIHCLNKIVLFNFFLYHCYSFIWTLIWMILTFLNRIFFMETENFHMKHLNKFIHLELYLYLPFFVKVNF